VEDPWPEGPFGVVSIIDVLHHVPLDARRGLFEQAAAHLRQGGLLIYKDMAQRPVWKATANRIHDLILARQWIHYLPVELVEQWMAELGFRLTQSEEISMYAYQHQLRVFEKKGR
jgi:cyclopropane fatty-acyl-phospholipid synthase-like methyltransferase